MIDSPLAQQLIDEDSALQVEINPFLTICEEIHEVLGPANADLGGSAPIGDIVDTRDTTARRMADFAANGLMSLAFPKHDDFFQLDAPYRNPSDGAKRHFHEKTEELQYMLQETNFFDATPATIWEGGSYGTGLIKMDIDENGEVYFKHQPFGTYRIQENYRGELIGVWRKVEWTVAQVLDFMQTEELPQDFPEQLKNAYLDPKRRGEKFEFLHCVKKLKEHERRNTRGQFPYGDYFVYVEGKQVLQEKGHHFMPFLSRRHQRFSNWTYGIGPGWHALEDAIQSSEASRLFEATVARNTFPSLTVSGDFDGRPNLQPGGVNYSDRTSVGWGIDVLAPVGDHRAAFELMMNKHQNIESAFAADLYRGLDGDSRVYSAAQTQAIENSRNSQLYPSALRLESEMGKPMLQNLYMIAEKTGRFEGIDIPDEVRDFEQDQSGNTLKRPRFRLRSRITTSVQRQQTLAFAQFIEMFAPVFQNKPEELMRFNFEEIMPDAMRASGFAERWIKPNDQYDKEIEELRQREQQAAAAEQAKQLAGAMKDAGGADAVRQMQEQG